MFDEMRWKLRRDRRADEVHEPCVAQAMAIMAVDIVGPNWLWPRSRLACESRC